MDHEHAGDHDWWFDEDAESSYSGHSWSDEDYTGFSNSEGTSQRTGEASTLSSVSFKVEEYENIYENKNDEATLDFVEVSGPGPEWEDVDPNKDTKESFAGIGGLEWTGDADNEKTFGTSWLDKLRGGDGDDQMYGFAGDDLLEGGNGRDSIFGGPGNDVIFTGL